MLMVAASINDTEKDNPIPVFSVQQIL